MARWYYADPDDPRLWVPRSVGVGWSLNFAHRWAWPVLIAMVGPPLAFAAVVIAVVRK